MISLLMPTRGRFDFAHKALCSIINSAENKNSYEVIFGIDDDDIETGKLINNFCKQNNINYKIIIFKRLNYKNFHIYVYELSKYAKGDLLWCAYPDDMQILTKNWDSILLNKYYDALYLKVELTCGFNKWKYSIVPIIHKKWIETTGRVSCNSQTDVWMGTIAEQLEIVTNVKEILCNIFHPPNAKQHNAQDIELPHIKKEWYIDKDKIKNLITLL